MTERDAKRLLARASSELCVSYVVDTWTDEIEYFEKQAMGLSTPAAFGLALALIACEHPAADSRSHAITVRSASAVQVEAFSASPAGPAAAAPSDNIVSAAERGAAGASASPGCPPPGVSAEVTAEKRPSLPLPAPRYIRLGGIPPRLPPPGTGTAGR